LLLILDNCEHLAISCTGLIREILRRCPRLKLLVTTQMQFAADFGACVEVIPLDTPSADTEPVPEILRRSATVQLFESIAQNRRQDFQLSTENAAIVARICRS